MICIVGADGFFGTYLTDYILSSCPHVPLLCLDHEEAAFSDGRVFHGKFELSDPDSIKKASEMLSRFSDIRIIFLSSVHNPDVIKNDPGRAEYINTVCYENFLRETESLDIKRLIYASSDTVYGESTDGYIFTETDELHPINIYGEHKKSAEEITRKYSYSIARYSYMYAPSLTSRKKHFYDTVREKLLNGEKMYMLTDWVRSAISYPQASEVTVKYLLSDTKENILNICGDTAVSKYDIGLKIAEKSGVAPSLVVPCTAEELGIFSERRAEKILMSNALMKKSGFSENTDLSF